MNPHCTGPCDQGRRPCPCTLACELEPRSGKDTFELLGMAFLAVVLAAVIVLLLTLLSR